MPQTSMLNPRWRLLARLRMFCNASCIAAIAAGCATLLARLLHTGTSSWPLPGLLAIRASVSLGSIFMGISLWLLLPDPPRRERRFFGLVFGALTACVGAVAAIERILGLESHVDQILAGHSAAAPPLRMPPSTSTAFLALGLALLLVDWKTRKGRRPSQLLSLWGVLVGLMSLSGYVYRASAIYKFFSFTQPALFTAVILALMSAAIFFARPRAGIAGDLTGNHVGSKMARRFLPPILVIPVFLGWIRMHAQRAGWYGPELGSALNTTVNVVTLSVLLWLNARKLNKTEESLEEIREAGNVYYDASLKDELTGLYNRRGFLTFAEEQIKLACSGRRELLVVFADVDGLKTINDNHGHSEGDRALKKTAEVLLTVFRDTDIVARLGGDEFAALAIDCSAVGPVRINAHFEKLLRTINARSNPWELSISVGTIHVSSQNKLSLDDILVQADKLMYERKRARPVAALR